MKKTFLLLTLILFIASTTIPRSMAQSWIPQGIHRTTVLVERYKFQDPNNTLADIDEDYEDAKKAHIEAINKNLDRYNNSLDSTFRAYKSPYKLAVLGKIDEEYPDKNAYRYILRRELFFGNKKILNPATQRVEDKSYFAYKYYFYDRLLRKNLDYYYFSGDQWSQVRRIIFWLNNAK